MKNISCDECQKKIDDYIAHTLDDKEMETFIYHVKDCKVCMEELSINYSVITALDQLNRNMELSEDYDKEIQLQIKRYVDKKNRIKILFSALTAILFVASIAIGVLLSILLYDKPISYSADEEAKTISIGYDGVPPFMDNVKIKIDKYNADVIHYLHERISNE